MISFLDGSLAVISIWDTNKQSFIKSFGVVHSDIMLYCRCVFDNRDRTIDIIKGDRIIVYAKQNM